MRRGALPRINQEAEGGPHPIKPERVAMEEVRQGLVHYEVPHVRGRDDAQAAS